MASAGVGPRGIQRRRSSVSFVRRCLARSRCSCVLRNRWADPGLLPYCGSVQHRPSRPQWRHRGAARRGKCSPVARGSDTAGAPREGGVHAGRRLCRRPDTCHQVASTFWEPAGLEPWWSRSSLWDSSTRLAGGDPGGERIAPRAQRLPAPESEASRVKASVAQTHRSGGEASAGVVSCRVRDERRLPVHEKGRDRCCGARPSL